MNSVLHAFRLGAPFDARKNFNETVPESSFGAKFTRIAKRVLQKMHPDLREAALAKKGQSLFEQCTAMEARYRANPSVNYFKKVQSMHALMLFHYWHGFGRTIYAVEQKLANFFGHAEELHKRVDEINQKLDTILGLMQKPNDFDKTITPGHALVEVGKKTLRHLKKTTDAERKKVHVIRSSLNDIVAAANQLQHDTKKDVVLFDKLQQTIVKSESIIQATKLEQSTKEVLDAIQRHLSL